MDLTHSPIAALRRLAALGGLMILSASIFAAENGFSLVDVQGTEINVEVMSDQGEILAVWFVDHEEERPQFENMLRAINCVRRRGLEGRFVGGLLSAPYQ